MVSNCKLDLMEEDKMEPTDFIEIISKTIEQKVIKEWKHKGYIDVMHSDDVSVVIDGKRFVISVKESVV